MLYSIAMTDALLSLATAGLYAAKWTTRIAGEWIRALENSRPDLAGRLDVRRDCMRAAVPDWEVVPEQSKRLPNRRQGPGLLSYHGHRDRQPIGLAGFRAICLRPALRHPVFVTSAIVARGEEPTIVETIPGWAHDITSIGEEEKIVMLWANEVFDRARPDTVACAVEVAGEIGGRL